jgi:hypothetical protein
MLLILGLGPNDRDKSLTRVASFWLGFTPDDSPLLLEDAGTQEIARMGWTAPYPARRRCIVR